MSIETNENPPEKKIAPRKSELELFTDRNESIYLFASHLHQKPTPEEILFFYGGGGNGKTLLLKYLRKKCCKLFHNDTWQGIITQSEAEAAFLIANTTDKKKFITIPGIIHDFGQPPRQDRSPRGEVTGLLMLRQNLAQKAKDCGYRLSFPLFNFAIYYYFHKIGKSDEEIKKSFPSDELSLLVQVIEYFAGIPGLSLVTESFKILAKRMDLKEMLLKRGMNPDKVNEIKEMELEGESGLIEHLPEYLAEDLNAAMTEAQAPPRLVIFLDTHEKFWGIKRNLRGTEFFKQDRWLRHFLRFLHLDKEIIVVVAGRNLPKWAEITEKKEYKIPQKYINTQLVGHLTAADARVYLDKAGIITREKLATAMIDYASVSPDQIHPFLLSLCVDVVRSAEGKVALTPADFSSQAVAENKPQELFDKLLVYVDRQIEYAVHALCGSRGFNYQIYKHLGQTLEFVATRPDFEILTEFSFVWQDEKHGEDWYRIHDLLRRLYRENPQNTTQRAHMVLEAYWRERGNISEAIYHANCLDWERSLTEWTKVFDHALKRSRYEQCRSLLEVRTELKIDSHWWLGRISQLEGDYLAQLARHAEAEAEFAEAIAAYDQALSLAPNDKAYISALNNKGTVLQSLGELQASLSQHSEAVKTYKSAIAAFERCLNLAPNDISALNNQGNVLRSLGDIQTSLSQHSEAVECYQSAIAAYKRTLTLAPNDISALNNQGLALRDLGDIQASLTQNTEAVESYQSAITAFWQALIIAAHDISALNNQENALQGLGDIQASLTQNTEAVESFQSALSAFCRTLTLAPDSNQILNNQGLAEQSLGDLQASLSQHLEAVKSYQSAIAAYEIALIIAPDYISALNNKGNALSKLGGLQASLSQHLEAAKSYQSAIAAYDRCLTLAPDYINALNNQVAALHSLGDIQASLTQNTEAVENYQTAIAAFERAITLAPNYTQILNNKGNALRSLGDIQASSSQHPEAIKSYQSAINVYDRALTVAPDYVDALNNQGIALSKLGDIQASLSQHSEAVKSCQSAIAAYDRALTLVPDDIYALNNQGLTLINLGQLYSELSMDEEAIKNWQTARSILSRSLKIAPNDIFIQNQYTKLDALLHGK